MSRHQQKQRRFKPQANNPTPESLFFNACFDGNLPMVRLCLSKVDVKKQHSLALRVAAAQSFKNIVDVLLPLSDAIDTFTQIELRMLFIRASQVEAGDCTMHPLRVSDSMLDYMLGKQLQASLPEAEPSHRPVKRL